MKIFQVLHAVFTILLVLCLIGIGGLYVAGVITIRSPNTTNASNQQANHNAGAQAQLLVIRGRKTNLRYPIYEGDNFIGRADQKAVDIDIEFLEEPDRIWSSREHAKITCKNGDLMIEDLNSANGTYLHRNRLKPGQKYTLRQGDILQIGEIQFKVIP